MAINRIIPTQLGKGPKITPASASATSAGIAAPASAKDVSHILLSALLPKDLRMLLVGDTGSGKTTQFGEVVEVMALETGLPAVLFRADKGGNLPIKPHIDAGLIVEYAYDWRIDPWIWISHAIRGEAFIFDDPESTDAEASGKWVKVTKDKCLAGYEGLTAFSELLMMELGRIGAEQPQLAVGGEAAWQYETSFAGEELKIGGSTQSHYGLVQLRIMSEVWKADPGVPSIWTAILARATDATGAGGILGAMTTGKAQAGIVARWFDYTFRLNTQPQETGDARHILYLDTHLDKQARGVKVIANARMPLKGGDTHPVDLKIEPADLVLALRQLCARQGSVTGDLKARFDAARGRKS